MINRNRTELWKEDIKASVDFYNDWFIKFAPKAYKDSREAAIKQVQNALQISNDFRDLSIDLLKNNPGLLQILRMSTCPPLARDRISGLANVKKSIVQGMESDPPKIPVRLAASELDEALAKIIKLIIQLLDTDIITWNDLRIQSKADVQRAATIIADRLCGSVADPIIRNAQELRQLKYLSKHLESKGYVKAVLNTKFDAMLPGTYSIHTNIPIILEAENEKTVNIPVDMLIQLRQSEPGELPIMIEAKSAGDFTNVNKRRKEEAVKMAQLRKTYGNNIVYLLFLCGYFDSGYLGYEAAEGIDWVWEHRIEDIDKVGL